MRTLVRRLLSGLAGLIVRTLVRRVGRDLDSERSNRARLRLSDRTASQVQVLW